MRLIRIEFNKLITYKTFWFFVASYLILLPLLLISFHKFNIQIQTTTIGFDFYYFPDVWHNVTYIASWFNILLYFFMILLITNEFQFRTFRQHLIDGLSKNEVLASKLLMVIGLTAFCTFYVAICAFCCGYFMTDSFAWDIAWVKAPYLYGYFIQLLGHLIFALFLSLVLQRQGITMIVFILYITVIENILRFRVLPAPINNYLPLKTFSDLIPNPFPAFFGQTLPSAPELKPMVLSLFYMVLMIGLSSLWLHKKSF